MSEYITRSTKEFKDIIAATFPEYKRRTVVVIPTETVAVYDLNWSGGTRMQYRACTINGKPTGNLDKYSMRHPISNMGVEGSQVSTFPGHVIVKGGHFCGKVAQLYIYCHPSDMPRVIVDSTEEG